MAILKQCDRCKEIVSQYAGASFAQVHVDGGRDGEDQALELCPACKGALDFFMANKPTIARAKN